MCVTTEWRSRSYIYKNYTETSHKSSLRFPLMCQSKSIGNLIKWWYWFKKNISLSLSLLSHSLCLSSLSETSRYIYIYSSMTSLSFLLSLSLSLTYTCRYIFLTSVYQCLSLPFSLRDFLSHIHIHLISQLHWNTACKDNQHHSKSINHHSIIIIFWDTS